METAKPNKPSIGALASLLEEKQVLVLTGAGISTESGIPDYRGPESSQRRKEPILYQQFVGDVAIRQRYWARSLVGWPFIQQAQPNAGHKAIARLEGAGLVSGVLTQNVDGLHQAAGSRKVIELHGSLATVRCLVCHQLESRRQLQERMLALNPDFEAADTKLAPDGDAEIPPELIDRFQVPVCQRCGGLLKPGVIFFGENVPQERVARAWQMLSGADVLLVAGSSLAVFSGYRFVTRASETGKPVVIINDGPTRGDPQATLRISGRLGNILPELATMLV